MSSVVHSPDDDHELYSTAARYAQTAADGDEPTAWPATQTDAAGTTLGATTAPTSTALALANVSGVPDDASHTAALVVRPSGAEDTTLSHPLADAVDTLAPYGALGVDDDLSEGSPETLFQRAERLVSLVGLTAESDLRGELTAAHLDASTSDDDDDDDADDGSFVFSSDDDDDDGADAAGQGAASGGDQRPRSRRAILAARHELDDLIRSLPVGQCTRLFSHISVHIDHYEGTTKNINTLIWFGDLLTHAMASFTNYAPGNLDCGERHFWALKLYGMVLDQMLVLFSARFSAKGQIAAAAHDYIIDTLPRALRAVARSTNKRHAGVLFITGKIDECGRRLAHLVQGTLPEPTRRLLRLLSVNPETGDIINFFKDAELTAKKAKWYDAVLLLNAMVERAKMSLGDLGQLQAFLFRQTEERCHWRWIYAIADAFTQLAIESPIRAVKLQAVQAYESHLDLLDLVSLQKFLVPGRNKYIRFGVEAGVRRIISWGTLDVNNEILDLKQRLADHERRANTIAARAARAARAAAHDAEARAATAQRRLAHCQADLTTARNNLARRTHEHERELAALGADKDALAQQLAQAHTETREAEAGRRAAEAKLAQAMAAMADYQHLKAHANALADDLDDLHDTHTQLRVAHEQTLGTLKDATSRADHAAVFRGHWEQAKGERDALRASLEASEGKRRALEDELRALHAGLAEMEHEVSGTHAQLEAKAREAKAAHAGEQAAHAETAAALAALEDAHTKATQDAAKAAAVSRVQHEAAAAALADAQAQLAAATANFAEQQTLAQSLQAQLADLLKEHAALQATHDARHSDATGRYAELETRHRDAVARVHDLERQLHGVQTSHDHLERRAGQLEAERTGDKAELQALREKLAIVKGLLDEQQRARDAADARAAAAETALAEAQNADTIGQLRAARAALQAQLAEHREQLAEARAGLAHVTAARQAADADARDARAAQGSAEHRAALLEAQVAHLKELLDKAEAAHAATRDSLARIQEAHAHEKTQHSVKHSALEDLTARHATEVGDLRERIRELTGHVSDRDRQIEERTQALDAANTRVAELQVENAHLGKALAEAQSLAETEAAHHARFRAASQALEKELQAARANADALTSKLQAEAARHSDTAAALAALQETHASTQHAKDTLDAQQTSLTARYAALEAERDRMAERVADLEDELEGINATMHRLKTTPQELVQHREKVYAEWATWRADLAALGCPLREDADPVPHHEDLSLEALLDLRSQLLAMAMARLRELVEMEARILNEGMSVDALCLLRRAEQAATEAWLGLHHDALEAPIETPTLDTCTLASLAATNTAVRDDVLAQLQALEAEIEVARNEGRYFDSLIDMQVAKEMEAQFIQLKSRLENTKKEEKTQHDKKVVSKVLGAWGKKKRG